MKLYFNLLNKAKNCSKPNSKMVSTKASKIKYYNYF